MSIERGKGSREVSKELAKQDTIDAVASGLRGLMRKRPFEKFLLEDNPGKTLEVTNKPVAPWRRNKDGIRVGREISVKLKEEQLVIKGIEEDTLKKVTPYRLDTSVTKSTKLLTDSDGPEAYLESEKWQGEDYWKRVEVRHARTVDERWKSSTEEEAQELRTIVEGLVSDAKEGKIKLSELQKQLVKDFDRIVENTKDSLVDFGDGKGIVLPLDSKSVRIAQGKNAEKTVSIAEPRDEYVFLETFTLYRGGSIQYKPTSLNANPQIKGSEVSPVDADRKQITYLGETLTKLSKETIKKELSSREELRTTMENILTAKGTSYDEIRAVEIPLCPSHVSLRKIPTEAGPSFVMAISSSGDIDATSDSSFSDEGNILRQNFTLNPGKPLEVMTFFSGETTRPVARVATEEEKDTVVFPLLKTLFLI